MPRLSLETRAKHTAYMRQYYIDNPEKKTAWKQWFKKYRKQNVAYNKKFKAPYIEKLKGQRRAVKEFYLQAKTAPCMDCGVQYNPWTMQFDHRDPPKKLADVCRLVACGRSLNIVKTEIAKCDLVCANCHTNRTHKQRTGY